MKPDRPQARGLSHSPDRDSEKGAAVYAAYVATQVANQEARKYSFEQRGLAVITTSGVLVSVLFGLSATLTSATGYQLPHASRGWILGALICFVGAAVAAILTNVPLKYSGVTVDALKKTIEERWQDSAAEAQREVALTQVKVIRRAKERNRLKGWALIAAISAEIAALFCLAVAVGVILYS